jgi:glucokinase
VRLTNLPWTIHAAGLRGRLRIERIGLINDLEGAGYGIDSVDPSRLLILQAGIPEPHGVRALIGAGTGLGEAWMASREGLYDVFAGEGGHVDFAPRDSLESDLLAHLRARLGRVSVEHVLSGAGLKRIFDYLLWRSRTELPPLLAREFDTVDAAAVICRHALARDDATAAAALQCYIRIYAAQAANLALTVGARGGVYVVGGIAAKISAALGTGGFLAAFLDHPAMAAWLRRIPLCVVLDEDVVVMGARAYALRYA